MKDDPRLRVPETASAISADLDLRVQIEEAARVDVDTDQRLLDMLDCPYV